MDWSMFRISPGAWLAPAVDWLNINFHGFFSAVTKVIEACLKGLESVLLFLPAWALIGLAAGIVLVTLGWRLAALVAGCLGFCLTMGLWQGTMQTIALVTVSVAISVAIAFPLGILAARRRRVTHVK